MSTQFIFGAIIYVVSWFGSRLIAGKALQTVHKKERKNITKADPERKNIFTSVFMVAFLIYFALIDLLPYMPAGGKVALFCAVPIYVVSRCYFNLKKLKQLNVQSDFIRRIIASYVFFLSGIFIFMALTRGSIAIRIF